MTHEKATYLAVTMEYLLQRTRALKGAGWPVSRWIQFCASMLRCGYVVELYEARETESKYIYVYHGDLCYKVRFSAHSPTYRDCDLFVGGERSKSSVNLYYAIIDTIANLEP